MSEVNVNFNINVDANELIKQAKELNANPQINLINYDNLKNFLINATEEEIIEYGKKDYKRAAKKQFLCCP